MGLSENLEVNCDHGTSEFTFEEMPHLESAIKVSEDFFAKFSTDSALEVEISAILSNNGIEFAKREIVPAGTELVLPAVEFVSSGPYPKQYPYCSLLTGCIYLNENREQRLMMNEIEAEIGFSSGVARLWPFGTSRKLQFKREDQMKLVAAVSNLILQRYEIDTLAGFPAIKSLFETKKEDTIIPQEIFLRNYSERIKMTRREFLNYLIRNQIADMLTKGDDALFSHLITSYSNMFTTTGHTEFRRKHDIIMKAYKSSLERSALSNFLSCKSEQIDSHTATAWRLVTSEQLQRKQFELNFAGLEYPITKCVYLAHCEIEGKDENQIITVRPHPSELPVRAKVMKEFSSIASEIREKKKQKNQYLKVPQFYWEETVSLADGRSFDVLARSYVSGSSINKILLDIEKSFASPQEHRSNLKKADLSRGIIRAVSTVLARTLAVGIGVTERLPELLDKDHTEDFEKTLTMYTKKISDLVIGGDHVSIVFSYQLSQTAKTPVVPFHGALYHCLSEKYHERFDDKLEYYKNWLLEGIKPVLESVSRLKPGIFTDRSPTNLILPGHAIPQDEFLGTLIEKVCDSGPSVYGSVDLEFKTRPVLTDVIIAIAGTPLASYEDLTEITRYDVNKNTPEGLYYQGKLIAKVGDRISLIDYHVLRCYKEISNEIEELKTLGIITGNASAEELFPKTWEELQKATAELLILDSCLCYATTFRAIVSGRFSKGDDFNDQYYWRLDQLLKTAQAGSKKLIELTENKDEYTKQGAERLYSFFKEIRGDQDREGEANPSKETCSVSTY